MKQTILPGWKKDFHRPVPKDFTYSKAMDDLMYFEQETVDLDEFYGKYKGEIIYSNYLEYNAVLQSDAKLLNLRYYIFFTYIFRQFF